MDITNDPLDISIRPQDDNQITSFWSRLVQILKRWKIFLYPNLPMRQNSESSSTRARTEESEETLGQSLQKRVYTVDDCDLHDILRSTGKITWSEWDLLIDENGKTLEIAKSFQKNFENIKESSSIIDQVNIIKEIYLQFPVNGAYQRNIEEALENACLHNDPKYVVTAYTYDNKFTKRLNAHLAANAYHFIKLYCTILNCPTLHLTKDYVDAFTYILFHPKLNAYRVKSDIVYRGTVFDDEKPIENFKPGATILTTTYLSTSRKAEVARCFCNLDNNDSTKISVFCKYILNNTHGSSALDISELSQFPDEEEILLLRFVPFKIKSMERIENRRIEICFEQYSEVLYSNQSESDNGNSISMHRIEAESGIVGLAGTRDELNFSSRRDEEHHMDMISHCECESETNRNRITFRR